MNQYAVLVFRDQPFTDAEQLAFAQRLDGTLHAKTGAAVLGKNRFGNEALADISNVDESGALLKSGDRRRMYALGNRLWHTDASFQDPPGRYSMLSARVVPPVDADTEFADMRSAYDALERTAKLKLERSARSSFDRLLATDARIRILAGRRGDSCAVLCIRWFATIPSAAAAARSISLRMPRTSSTGRFRKAVCCCAISSSTPRNAHSFTATHGASAIS